MYLCLHNYKLDYKFESVYLVRLLKISDMIFWLLFTTKKGNNSLVLDKEKLFILEKK